MSFLSFSGRATRKEYWIYAWIPFLAVPGVGVIIFAPAAILTFDLWLPSAIAGMSYVAVLIQGVASPYWLAITVRRLHDTGRSAWWLLPYAVIAVGWVLIIAGFLAANPLSPLRSRVELYSVIWVLVNWAFVIALLVLCSGLGTIGSNRYGQQPGIAEESGWGNVGLTPTKSLGTNARTENIRFFLRSVGVLGFWSLAIASAMVLLAGFTLFFVYFVMPLITGTFIEGRMDV